eukprot:GHRR01020749.1.p1 GENE.GHRR01020749.1~~GHRR01020749.1.p1  ORF type:complete len:177 (+),score=42.71 GHRR01020749.1:556-1086(+)
MYPPYGPLTAERLQQVEELVRQFPGCRAINPDRSVFDLPLELKDKKTTALRISLPPHFPQERPMLSVIIPVVHPNVDPNGRVHTSLLNNWVYGISRLESVVAEAVSALTEGVTDSRQPGMVAFWAYMCVVWILLDILFIVIAEGGFLITRLDVVAEATATNANDVTDSRQPGTGQG